MSSPENVIVILRKDQPTTDVHSPFRKVPLDCGVAAQLKVQDFGFVISFKPGKMQLSN